MTLPKIRCCDIPYRQGFIEVVGNIHPGHVNLEVWKVLPETNVSQRDWGDESLIDAYTANVELELSLDEARELSKRLSAAIEFLEQRQ